MKIALCNEVIAKGREFAEQCAMTAALGYGGLEVAPFTLDEVPHRLNDARIVSLRRAAADAGIAVSGLHWLLVTPAGLSITSADAAVRAATLDVMRRLIDLCAALGGQILVHGSPAQRRLPEGAENAAARQRGAEAFAAVAEHAAGAGVVYCIEPLAHPEANFVNTLAEAAAIVTAVGNPALRTMIDCSAAGRMEVAPLAAVVDRWLPTGLLAHVQVNDRNRRGPGQGDDKFVALFATLRRRAYAGWIAVEPFDYVPDGPTAAARAIGYIQGIIEGLV